MGQKCVALLKTIIGIVVFICAAFFSTYFYFIPKENIFKSIYPGFIYTIGTVIVIFLFKKVPSLLNFIFYCCLMVATYYMIWVLTIYSSYLSFIVGILTAGGGSLITFFLADKYITKVSFNKRNVFIVGGISFFLTLILLYSWNSVYDSPPIEYIFHLQFSQDTIYGEAIFFWQLFVGIKFVLTFQRTNQ